MFVLLRDHGPMLCSVKKAKGRRARGTPHSGYGTKLDDETKQYIQVVLKVLDLVGCVRAGQKKEHITRQRGVRRVSD